MSSLTDAGVARAAVRFDRVFSPQEGLTSPVEQPWRQEICLNGSWQFQPTALPENYDIENGAPQLPEPADTGWSSTPIRIPSPWNINAFGISRFMAFTRTFPSYPKEWDAARMGWLRRTFTVPADWKEKRLVLHFEAICGFAQVFVNGHEVAEHFDNSLPFSVDVTDFVERDGENLLLVGIRQASLFDVPGMFGRHTYPAGSNWNMSMIGIWQDVFLRGLPALRVEDVALRPLVDQGFLEVAVTVRNSLGDTRDFALGGEIRPWINQAGTDLLSAPEPKWTLGQAVVHVPVVKRRIGPRTTLTLTLRRPIKPDELRFWTPESPNLYGLVLDVEQDGKIVDRFYQRFGWRQWGISGRDVTLNGKPYQLRADSGHLLGVTYMTRRYTWSWYRAIKDVNGNAIRLHATVRPRFYLDLADEMGLAILDESDIWASSMEFNYHAPQTWQRFEDHLEGMVRRDRNHASVFGWSIANEVLSALWWKGIPRKFWPPVIDGFVALGDRVKELDPTRPWISSDGDGDFHGRLPTYIYHYGKPADWKRQAPKDKPFGIGEGGSMLWGSPVVFSAYNGERSYESREGMMEGIAIEQYWYLVEQRKTSAFCSIFTVAGVCFEPLMLGVIDPAGRPGPDDGIEFGPFVEGQPGMQPERIAAFGTNFNPGYDPNQPFYKTTVVFEAIKAAYAPEGPQPCRWDQRVISPERPKSPAPTVRRVAFIGDKSSNLARALESSGVPATANGAADERVLVIDGGSLTDVLVPFAREGMRAMLQRGGTVFVWTAPEHLAELNQLLPAELSLTRESGTALFADRTAPETASFALADLYFQDQADSTILHHGLAGPLVQQGRVLMRENSFGRRWFVNADGTRAPALVALDLLGGRLLVTSLSPDVRSARRVQLVRSLFANLGVALGEPSYAHDTGFDGAGYVNQALVAGDFQGATYPGILDVDFLGGEATVDPVPGAPARDRSWQVTRSLGDGTFDFFRLELPGTAGTRARVENSAGATLRPEALDANNYLEVVERVSGTIPGTNSVVYLSFWVRAPNQVDASQLSIALRSDDGVKVWVEGKEIYREYTIYGPGMTEPKKVPLALEAGWNHVLVKVGQLDGPWLFAAKFESSDPGLVPQLRASATRP